MTFYYKGKISSSKSIMNRGLICSSFNDKLTVEGDSKCDDVKQMEMAIDGLGVEKEFDCGAAGTVFRFLAFRLSRMEGRFKLKGSKRLLSRPQEELVRILEHLGVMVKMEKDGLVIEGNGWKLEDFAVNVDRSKSSQFITGLMLSSWDLPHPVEITWQGDVVSDSYFQMTLKMLNDLGMAFIESENSITILPSQEIRDGLYKVETDLSSAFALAAVAAVSGELFLEDFPVESIQPDAVFVNMLKNMNVPVEMKDGVLHVSKAERLKGGNWNLIDCPDLFPVLAVLCGLAEGKSQLYGAPHLIYKESNRIDKTAELLDYIGARYEKKDDGMIIEGTTEDNRKKSFKFKTDEDHRLAFAAEVIRKAGYDKIKIKGEEVVNKSFPDFWDIMQGKK